MTPQVLITECRRRGITLEVMGDWLRCRAPMGVLTLELKHALTDHKAALMQILATEASVSLPPEVADNRELVAIKVWSDVLQEAIWVVVDDLPHEAWPIDAPVYTYDEMKILAQVGPETLCWVQAVKEIFGASVVGGRKARENFQRG
jgi:hypothetical protein